MVPHPEGPQQVRFYSFRTQNSIKNRFYGTLRNYVRFVLSYFDSRRICHNREISKLSPKFLTDLYSSSSGTNKIK